MTVMHEVELALRVVALPLMGALGVLAAVRDDAARLRARETPAEPGHVADPYLVLGGLTGWDGIRADRRP